MDQLTKALENNNIFESEFEAFIYITLLREGAIGAEKLHQKTGFHRESIQRALKKMEKSGTVVFLKAGRNKKAQAVSVARLQEKIETTRDNFTLLLKPLLEAEANKRGPKIELYTSSHAFGLLQMKLIKQQPVGEAIRVISTHPKKWLEAMVIAKKLGQFENVRLEKKIGFLLSCFSEFRGQVEYNNREYFAGQPDSLKRRYRYVETENSSPLQVQVWFTSVVISIFDSASSVHILVEDGRVVKAMTSYFQVLWSIGGRQ